MKKLFVSLKANGGDFAVFFVLNTAVILFLFIVQWLAFRHGNVYGLLDQSFPELHPGRNLFNALFFWDSSRGAGETQYLFLMQNIEYLLVWFLSLFFHTFSTLNFVKLFLSQYLYYIGSFLFFYTSLKFILKKEITYKNLSLVSVFALLTVCNIYFFQSAVAYVFNQRFDIFLFGLLFYAINRLLHENKGWGIFIVGSLLSMGSWINLPFWVPCVGLLFLYLIFFAKNYKLVLKMLGLHALLILPALVTLALFYKGLNIQTSTIGQYKDTEFIYANRNSTLLHILSFIGGVNWDLGWGWDNTGVYTFYTFFKNNFLFTASSMALFIFYAFSHLYKRVQARTFGAFLDMGVLVSIFMVASYNAPFGKFFTYLVDHAPLFIMFRESHNKFYPILLLCLLGSIFVSIFSVGTLVKRIVAGIFIVYIGVFIYTGLRYSMFNSEGSFTFPAQNYAVLNSVIPAESRVLFLPQYGYVKRYAYGYAGNSITRFNYSFEQFEISYLLDTNFYNPKVREMLDNFNYEQYDKGLYNFGLPNPSFSSSLLNNLEVTYVVFDKNIIGDSGNVPFHDGPSYISQLRKLTGFNMALENKDFLVMKNVTPRSQMQSGNITFQKINPTEYKLYVRNISSPQDVSFLQSFDTGWKLYEQKYSTSQRCENPSSYAYQDTNISPNQASPGFVNYTIKPKETVAAVAKRLGIAYAAVLGLNGIKTTDTIAVGRVLQIPRQGPPRPNQQVTTECQPQHKFFTGTELSFFWKKPVFDASHRMISGYANGWTLDAASIKNNFSSANYHQNPDGSLDVELLLYFKPQSYWYLAILATGITVVCTGFFIYNRKKRGKVTQIIYVPKV